MVASPKVSTLDDVRRFQIIGEQPESELRISEDWIVFDSTHFTRTFFFIVTIFNDDPYPIAFCFKAKEHALFMISDPYGILQPKSSMNVKLFLKKVTNWPRHPDIIYNTKQCLVVENLRIPNEIKPTDQQAAHEIGRDIFKRSTQENPQQRLYSKVNVVIAKKTV